MVDDHGLDVEKFQIYVDKDGCVASFLRKAILIFSMSDRYSSSLVLKIGKDQQIQAQEKIHC